MKDIYSILNGIWILEKDGLCLLHHSLSDDDAINNIDETMFSGLLTAMISFSQELINDTIRVLSMGEREIHYQAFDTFAVVLSVNKNHKKSPTIIHECINTIGKRFELEFENTLQKKGLCDLSIYESFSSVIDEIIGIQGIRKQQEDRSVLLDIFNNLKEDKLSINEGVALIYTLYESFDDTNKSFIKKAMKDVENIFRKAEVLTGNQRKKFQHIMKQVGSQIKAEQWLVGF